MIENIISVVKVRVCFGCKQYTHIFPENPQNFKFVDLFNNWHSGHTLQTISISEIDQTYILINENKRQKIGSVLINNVKNGFD